MSQIKPKTLFKVNLKSKWQNYDVIATQEKIDFFKEYYKAYEITVLEDLGMPDLEGIQIEVLGRDRIFSFSTQYYEVTSDRELTDADFDNLRALDCFMVGQVHGKVIKSDKINNKFRYSVKSECDSGD